jgi:hypothetical protein
LAKNSGFQISTPLGLPILQSGQETSFTLRMATTISGPCYAEVRLASNDPDDPLFSFDVKGKVVANSGAPADVIVDDLDEGFSVQGQWHQSGAVDKYAGSSLHTNSIGSLARWTPMLPVSGTYDVYAWWSAEAPWGGIYDRDSEADYIISHAGGTSVVIVDQDQDSGQWVLLGRFPFSAGTEGYVAVVRDSDNGVATSADAVRFVEIPQNSPVEVIVDDLDEGFSVLGHWQQSGAVDGYEDGSVHTNSIGSSARWTPTLPVSGMYDVYAWWSAKAPWGGTYDRDSEADYVISHAGGISTVVVDQDLNSGQWVLLGRFAFFAGTEGYVAVVRDSANGVATSADAVRFVEVLQDSPAEEVEVIVDDLDEGFSVQGTWQQSVAVDGYEGRSVHTNSIGSSARWTPMLPVSGMYDVYAWWSAKAPWGGTYDRDSEADYVIYHAGGTSSIRTTIRASGCCWDVFHFLRARDMLSYCATAPMA